jgi:hypothetical protein
MRVDEIDLVRVLSILEQTLLVFLRFDDLNANYNHPQCHLCHTADDYSSGYNVDHGRSQSLHRHLREMLSCHNEIDFFLLFLLLLLRVIVLVFG